MFSDRAFILQTPVGPTTCLGTFESLLFRWLIFSGGLDALALRGGLAALALRGPYVMWSYVAIRCVMSCYVNMVLKFAPCCAMLRYAVLCYVNVALDFVRC